MEIRDYESYNEGEILSLYESVGWTAYTDYPEVLREGFARSLVILGAYEGEKLLGILRAVGDGSPLCLCRIFWCFRSTSAKASVPRI